MMDVVPCCGRPAPWGPLCPLPINHKSAHEWGFRLTRDTEPEDVPETHADHLELGEPDPECEDCAEATADLWERLMVAY